MIWVFATQHVCQLTVSLTSNLYKIDHAVVVFLF